MTRDEWLQKVAADRPPLSAAQIAMLRPVLAPVVPHIRAAPAATGAAPAEPHSETPRKESA
jgi:uncharacterized protein (DUF4415 family)